MLTILAAALLGAGAGVSPCTPVPDSDRLWQPTTRWVLVGEQHGTNETPAAFANLVCLAAATGRPVTVALEYAQDWQPRIDAWLASDGGSQAHAALLALPKWTAPMQDGRSSVAFLHLFEQLREMKQAGLIQGVVATDVAWAKPTEEDRNEHMAKAWTAIPAPDNGLVLALVGNLHAARTPITSTINRPSSRPVR